MQTLLQHLLLNSFVTWVVTVELSVLKTGMFFFRVEITWL